VANRDLGESPHIHGLWARDLAIAPDFEQIVDELFLLVAGRQLVCHNARFDIGFLNYELRRADCAAPLPDAACTLEMAKAHGYPTRLVHLARALGVDHRRTHEALGDALATSLVFAGLSRGRGGPCPDVDSLLPLAPVDPSSACPRITPAPVRPSDYVARLSGAR